MLYNLFENRDFVSVFAVALLAEGVDRNPYAPHSIIYQRVALLAEGVDRNFSKNAVRGQPQVALLAEGVDRNQMGTFMFDRLDSSPSSRRAWIEIPMFMERLTANLSRPPRGGRG